MPTKKSYFLLTVEHEDAVGVPGIVGALDELRGIGLQECQDILDDTGAEPDEHRKAAFRLALKCGGVRALPDAIELPGVDVMLARFAELTYYAAKHYVETHPGSDALQINSPAESLSTMPTEVREVVCHVLDAMRGDFVNLATELLAEREIHRLQAAEPIVVGVSCAGGVVQAARADRENVSLLICDADDLAQVDQNDELDESAQKLVRRRANYEALPFEVY